MLPQQRACDACHAQKIRCVVKSSRASEGLNGACQSCHSLHLHCTTDRPQRRRPRVRRPSSGDQRGTGLNNDFHIESVSARGRCVSPKPISLVAPSVLANPSGEGDTASSPSLGVELICDQTIFNAILQDYSDRLYCLTPLLHKPSFQQDLTSNRAESDPLFFSFVFSLVAWVCSMLPARFEHYRILGNYFPYGTVSDLVERCETAVSQRRRGGYLEHPTTLHCCIAFSLYHSLSAVGLAGRARIYCAELDALMKMLGANDPATFVDLSPPDAQVRKKVFWLNFFVQVHSRLGNEIGRHLNWLPVPDTMFFDPACVESLLPIAVDDEYILQDRLLPQPVQRISITAGFIGIIRIFLCFVAPSARSGEVIDLAVGRQNNVFPRNTRQIVDRNAYCDLQDMLSRIHKVADIMPAAFGLGYGACLDFGLGNQVVADQFASMRANIHVTQMWARYLIFDRLVALQEAVYGAGALDRALIISEHEAICDNLLHFLNRVAIRDLESNGVPISFKIRQVAALLFEYSQSTSIANEANESEPLCSSSPQTEQRHTLTKRADALIAKFLDLLTRMDRETMQDSQRVLAVQIWKGTAYGTPTTVVDK